MGLSLAQDGGKTGRERKRGGAGAVASVLIGISGVEQRRGVRPGVAPHGKQVEVRHGGGVYPPGGQCPARSSPRPVGAGGVAWPCRAADLTGLREGADKRAWAHNARQLRQLIGGPGRTVPGGTVQTGFEIKTEFKWLKYF
jgi:hypothetical protein